MGLSQPHHQPKTETTSIRRGTPADFALLGQCDPRLLTDTTKQAELRHALEKRECLLLFHDEACAGFTLYNSRFLGYGFFSPITMHSEHKETHYLANFIRLILQDFGAPKIFTASTEANIQFRSVLKELDFSISGILYNVEEGPTLIYVKEVAHI